MTRSRSAGETERLGQALGLTARAGDVLALYGDLGTGKTVLVRGLATGLGIPPGEVSSPTFVLVHEYRGRLPLAHADLYRIETFGDLPHLGLSEYLDGKHVVVVEWAERAGLELPADRVEAHLTHRGNQTREIRLTATGPRARRWLEGVAHRVIEAPGRTGQRRRSRPPASRRSASRPRRP
ncbi:MAG: tRNA (adenosine(37)-N6)-threonylcarbamoyltransferase complex ATPase subunit type 1 TsaE [Nitrospirales bacterium]